MKFSTISALCAALLLAACNSDTPVTNPSAPDTGALAALQPNSNDGTTQTSLDGGPGSAKDFEANVGNTVHFDTDSYALNSAAQEGLQKQAAWLQKYPQHMVTIEGHADERGTREYNLALGDRRAQTVVNYLTALGVDAGRIKEVSYGKEKPVCADATDACWSQNRRGVTALDN